MTVPHAMQTALPLPSSLSMLVEEHFGHAPDVGGRSGLVVIPAGCTAIEGVETDVVEGIDIDCPTARNALLSLTVLAFSKLFEMEGIDMIVGILIVSPLRDNVNCREGYRGNCVGQRTLRGSNVVATRRARVNLTT